MEVFEIPTFWCPHVERATCTNFSPRTVELRPPESREIFPFPFPSFSFSFLSPYEFFSFLFVFFFSFSSFLRILFLSIYFLLFLISHLISLSFSPHFLLSLCISLPFRWALPYGSREGNSLLPSSIQMHGYHNSILIPYFFIPLYDIIHYMAQYEPWDSFPTHG